MDLFNPSTQFLDTTYFGEVPVLSNPWISDVKELSDDKKDSVGIICFNRLFIT